MLNEEWRIVCQKYLELFAKKHEIELDVENKYNWVGGDFGTVASIGDYFIGMDDIRYDIDHNVPVDMFLKWYDYSLILHELELTSVNYPSYIKGARPYDESDIEVIRELKYKVCQAQRDLDNAVFDLKYKKK